MARPPSPVDAAALLKTAQVQVVQTVDVEGLVQLLNGLKGTVRGLKAEVGELKAKNADLEARIWDVEHKPTPGDGAAAERPRRPAVVEPEAPTPPQPPRTAAAPTPPPPAAEEEPPVTAPGGVDGPTAPAPAPAPAPAVEEEEQPPPPSTSEGTSGNTYSADVVNNVTNVNFDATPLEDRIIELEDAARRASAAAAAAARRADSASAAASAASNEIATLKEVLDKLISAKSDVARDPNASADDRISALAEVMDDIRATANQSMRTAGQGLLKAQEMEPELRDVKDLGAQLKNAVAKLEGTVKGCDARLSNMENALAPVQESASAAYDIANSVANNLSLFMDSQDALNRRVRARLGWFLAMISRKANRTALDDMAAGFRALIKDFVAMLLQLKNQHGPAGAVPAGPAAGGAEKVALSIENLAGQVADIARDVADHKSDTKRDFEKAKLANEEVASRLGKGLKQAPAARATAPSTDLDEDGGKASLDNVHHANERLLHGMVEDVGNNKHSVKDLNHRVSLLETALHARVSEAYFEETIDKLRRDLADVTQLQSKLADREPRAPAGPAPAAPAEPRPNGAVVDDAELGRAFATLGDLAKRMAAAERDIHDHLERIRRGDAVDMDLERRLKEIELLDLRAVIRELKQRLDSVEGAPSLVPQPPQEPRAAAPAARFADQAAFNDVASRLATLEAQSGSVLSLREALADVQKRIAAAEEKSEQTGEEIAQTRGDMSKLRKKLEKLAANLGDLEQRLAEGAEAMNTDASMLTGRCLSCDRPLPEGIKSEVQWLARNKMPKGYVRVDDLDKVDVYGNREDVRDPQPAYHDGHEEPPRMPSPPSVRKGAALLPGTNPVRPMLDSAEMMRHADPRGTNASPREHAALTGATGPPTKLQTSTPSSWFASASTDAFATPDVPSEMAGRTERPNTSDVPRRPHASDAEIEEARARLKSAGEPSEYARSPRQGGGYFAKWQYTPYTRVNHAHGVPGRGYITHRGSLPVMNPSLSSSASVPNIPGGYSSSPAAALVSPRMMPGGYADARSHVIRSTPGGGRRDRNARVGAPVGRYVVASDRSGSHGGV